MSFLLPHTHWDREWFLPHQYVDSWLSHLFEKLYENIEKTKGYIFILDGQFLVLEDYLKKHPEKRDKIRRLVKKKNLLIGPYYAQIDWRLAGEEAIIKNLQIGIKESMKFGNVMKVGWLMDNFGHPSSSPTIHRLFDIEVLFLWRGVPLDKITPFFFWRGKDGSLVKVIFLFFGYRNFYNLSLTPHLLKERYAFEIKKLSDFFPKDAILLLDGYDLDILPEDPFKVLKNANIKDVRKIDPKEYAKILEKSINSIFVLEGELLSGKYASVFPGTLSTRSYLKTEESLIEKLLSHYLSPLRAVLLKHKIYYKDTTHYWKELLKTLIHDNIAGVGVDQINDRMEEKFFLLYNSIKNDIFFFLDAISKHFSLKKGDYIYIFSPYDYKTTVYQKGLLVDVFSNGIGIYKSKIRKPEEFTKEVASFSWRNEYYLFSFLKGKIKYNDTEFSLVFDLDDGDTYNSSFAGKEEELIFKKAILKENDKDHFVLTAFFEKVTNTQDISVAVDIIGDKTPVLKFKISTLTKGSNYCLFFVSKTPLKKYEIFAKMPFDVVKRKEKDTDLFGEKVPENLRKIIIAAREKGYVEEFPFQGFIYLEDNRKNKYVVFSDGLKEYIVRDGRIYIPLIRSVEWLAKKIKTRVGDAGPKMYVPGAKCEKEQSFVLGFYEGKDVWKWFYLFENPPIPFKVLEGDGVNEGVFFILDDIPVSTIEINDNRLVARVFNPSEKKIRLKKPYLEVDMFGKVLGYTNSINPGEIKNLVISPKKGKAAYAETYIYWPFSFPVKRDFTKVEDGKIKEMEKEIERYEKEISELWGLVKDKEGYEKEKLLWEIYTKTRKKYELEISVILNKEKAGKISKKEAKLLLEKIGYQLNLMRIKKRTYDYVLELIKHMEESEENGFIQDKKSY